MFSKVTLDRLLDHRVIIPEMQIYICKFHDRSSFWDGKKFGPFGDAIEYSSIRDAKTICRKIFTEVNVLPLPVSKETMGR